MICCTSSLVDNDLWSWYRDGHTALHWCQVSIISHQHTYHWPQHWQHSWSWTLITESLETKTTAWSGGGACVYPRKVCDTREVSDSGTSGVSSSEPGTRNNIAETRGYFRYLDLLSNYIFEIIIIFIKFSEWSYMGLSVEGLSWRSKLLRSEVSAVSAAVRVSLTQLTYIQDTELSSGSVWLRCQRHKIHGDINK